MIHLALEVLAFIFLAVFGLAVLGVIMRVLGAIGSALNKVFAPAPKPKPQAQAKTAKPQVHAKTRFALGHDPIEPNHDPNGCPICREDEADLYARAPRGLSTDDLHRWVTDERQKLGGEIRHIPGAPWGDPSSYVWASTPEKLEQARDDFQKREIQRRENEAEAALEQERKKLDEERREREAREFLVREAERVLKEREEREMRRTTREPEHEPVASAPVIIVRPPSKETEGEMCKCGYPGCLGHEFIDNHAIFPGFTSETAMARSPHELICFNVEVIGVAGNPSDGAIPESAVRIRRKPIT